MVHKIAVLAIAIFAIPVAGAAADTRFVGASSTGGSTLYVFNSDADGAGAAKTAPVSGIAAGDAIVGLDVRPATGELYALGHNSGTTQLYTIDLAPNAKSATATAVGGRLASMGASFGFDFNPTVDRIRVINDADENRRLNPINGALAATDTSLAYAGTDVNAGDDPAATAAAYTNSDNDPATGTTLYDIDTAQDVLVTQAPPNNGTLNTVGALGLDATPNAGFDIAGTGNAAYAVLQPAGSSTSSLYSIDLASGAATALGGLKKVPVALDSLAVVRDEA